MLPLAEDLGTIPPVCRQTLEELGICGLRVQRWEKWWDGDRLFARPDQYPVLSVSTLSTHDSELVPEWWEKEPAERQQLWTALGHEGPAPETLPAKVHRELLAFVGRTASEFAIHQLQELLFPLGLLPGPPADHRVNVPATISDRNWSWRCPVGLEELVRNAEWTAQVREMLRR
jgi:4-alpha-glucanotransferase